MCVYIICIYSSCLSDSALLIDPWLIQHFINWVFQFMNMLLLLLLVPGHFSRVRFCVTPSLGFSRQEHWSGLPFPSPMHKSEKWKWSRSAMSDSSRPYGLQPTRLLRPWDFPDKSTRVGCHCLLWTCYWLLLIWSF